MSPASPPRAATVEELTAFKALMDKAGSQQAGLLYGAAPATIGQLAGGLQAGGQQAGLADLDAAD